MALVPRQESPVPRVHQSEGIIKGGMNNGKSTTSYPALLYAGHPGARANYLKNVIGCK